MSGSFFCPQAYRYLREEVKTFQGKPIMVSFIAEMHTVIDLIMSSFFFFNIIKQ